MARNKTFETLYELNELITDLKRGHATLADAISKREDITVFDVQKIYDILEVARGGREDINKRFTEMEKTISDVDLAQSNLKKSDISFLFNELSAAIGPYGTLKEALEQKQTFKIDSQDGNYSVDVQTVSAIESKEINVTKNSVASVITEYAVQESINEVLIRDTASNVVFDTFGNSSASFESLPVSLVSTSEGLSIREPFEGDIRTLDFTDVFYKNYTTEDYQYYETSDFTAIFNHKKNTDGFDLRNIFREDDNLTHGHMLVTTTEWLERVVSVVMKKPRYIKTIRVYPYSSEWSGQEFDILVYNNLETLVSETNSSFLDTSNRNANKYFDVAVDDSVSQFTIILRGQSTGVKKFGLNKIQMMVYENDDVVEFESKNVVLPSASLLKNFNMSLSEKYRNNRSALELYGFNIDDEYYTYRPTLRTLNHRFLRDELGYNSFNNTIVKSRGVLSNSIMNQRWTESNIDYPIYNPGSWYSAYLNSNTSYMTSRYSGSEVYFHLSGLIRLKRQGYSNWTDFIPISGNTTISFDGVVVRIESVWMPGNFSKIKIQHLSNSNYSRLDVEVQFGRHRSSSYSNYTLTINSNYKTRTSNGIDYTLIQSNSVGSGSDFFAFVPFIHGLHKVTLSGSSTGSTTRVTATIENCMAPLTLFVGPTNTGNISDLVAYNTQRTDANYLPSEIKSKVVNDFDHYKIKICKTDYADGFSFGEVVSSSNCLYAFKNEDGKIYKYDLAQKKWVLINIATFKTHGNTNNQLQFIPEEAYNELSDLFELLVHIPLDGQFTSVQIKGKSNKFLKTTPESVSNMGLTSEMIAQIDPHVMYQTLVNSRVFNFKLVGFLKAFKGKSNAFVKFSASTDIIEHWRKLTKEEQDLIKVSFLQNFIKIENELPRDIGLLIKTLAPKKTTLLDSDTQENLELIVQNQDFIKGLIDNTRDVEDKVYNKILYELINSRIIHNYDFSHNIHNLMDAVHAPSYKGYNFERISCDRSGEFVTNVTKDLFLYEVGVNSVRYLNLPYSSSQSKVTCKFPVQTILNSTKNIKYEIDINKAPDKAVLRLNNLFDYEVPKENVRFNPDRATIDNLNVNYLNSLIGAPIINVSLTLEFDKPVGANTTSGNIIPVHTDWGSTVGLISQSNGHSSTPTGSWSAANVTQTNPALNTNWMKGSNSTPGFWQYRFHQPVLLSRIQIRNSNTYQTYQATITGVFANGQAVVLRDIVGFQSGAEISFDIPLEYYESIRVTTRLMNDANGYAGFNRIRIFGYGESVLFKNLRFFEEGDNSLGIDNDFLIGPQPLSIPYDGIAEIYLTKKTLVKYYVLVNGVRQKEGLDYTIEDRSGEKYLVWISQDFELETDDEVVLFIEE